MSTRLFLSLIVILGVLLRGYTLDVQSIWLDEATSLFVAEKSISDILRGVGFDSHTPPAYYLLLHVWLKITPWLRYLEGSWFTSTDAVALRSFSLAFDSLNIILFWLVSAQLLPRIAAFIAVTLYTFSPYLIFYAQEGRMYSFLVSLVLLTTLLTLRSRARALTKPELAALFAVGVLGMYTHYYYALFFASLSVAVLVEDRFTTKKSAQWLLLGFCIGLAFLPWIHIVTQLISSGGQSFRKFTFEVLPYTFLRFVVGYGVMPLTPSAKESMLTTLQNHSSVLAAPLLLFGIILLFAIPRMLQNESRQVSYILLPLVLPALMALIVSLKIPMLSERYLIVSYPFFLLACTYGLLQLRATSLGLALCLLVFCFGISQQATNPLFGNSNWRAAGDYLNTTDSRLPVAVIPAFADDCIRRNFRQPVVLASLEKSSDERKIDALSLSKFWILIEGSNKDTMKMLQEKGFELVEKVYYPQGNGLHVVLARASAGEG